MIVFKKVRYKNFLSTGQQFIEIQLDRSAKTLVVGENGAGKSTMLDALCFGLFQRAFRNIKKDQMVNSINEKDCAGWNGGDHEIRIVKIIRIKIRIGSRAKIIATYNIKLRNTMSARKSDRNCCIALCCCKSIS